MINRAVKRNDKTDEGTMIGDGNKGRSKKKKKNMIV